MWYARGFSGRWSGLLTSIVVGVVFLAVIAWSVFKGQTPSSANGATGGAGGQPELLPDAVVSGPISSIAELGHMYIEMTAKDDPNTLVGIIEADKVEPIDANERSVELPRAWIFLEGGRFGRVDADTGRFFMPDPNTAPESGLLEGNVRLRVYEATEDGETPIVEGDEAAEPIGIARFDEALRFDFRRSRASSAGHFVIESPSIEMAGTNLTAVFNEVQQRLELIEVRQGEYVKFTPTVSDPAADPATSPGVQPAVAQTSPAGATPPAANPGTPVAASPVTNPEISPAPAAPDLISFYHLTFLDGIDVQHQTHRLRGDQLDLWAKLVNNALPEGAVTPLAAMAEPDDPAASRQPTTRASTQGDTGETPPPDDGSVPQTQTAAADPASTPQTTVADDGAVTMRWTGPMRVQPLGDERPEALRDDDVALRLTAEKTGLVAFDDDTTGAEAKAVALDYGFTTANLALSGPGGNVSLSVSGSGELQASRMIASLGTGQIHVRGPGVMRVSDEAADAAADSTPEPTTIRWSEQADFEFAREGDRVTGLLRSAVLEGNIEATNGLDRLSGNRFDATFATTAEGRQRLDTLQIDRGRAEDREGGYLTGETLAVEFADGTLGHDMDAVRIDAWGQARAGRPGSEIRAGTLTASLGRNLEGDARIERIDASQAVVFDGDDGSSTRSQTLHVDTLTNSIELVGPDAMLAYRGSTITGPEIRIDGQNRRARVVGAGSFDQELPPEDGKPGGRVLAVWTEGMTYDDYLGRVECLGDAVVTSSPVPTQLDTVESQRVLITMSPYDEASPSRNDAMRRLLTATAYGGTDDDGTPAPASVESRAFASGDQSLVEQLMYLEGMQITADNVTSELAVPSAGKLLLLDRRPREGDAEPVEPDPAQPDLAQQDQAILTELATGGPGLTRFEWRGGMLMNRIDGTANMKRSVKITHKNLVSEQTYELHAERLDATIRESDPSQGAPGQTAHSELVRAEATGAVYFGSAERELIADRLLYDAENGVVIGTAAPGNLVTLFDATRGTPVTSRAIRWDLVNDVISIERPGAIVAPAGP